MKRSGRAVKFSTGVILAFIIITLLILMVLGCVVYSKINFEADERLFESSRRWNSTTFYADSEPGGEYTPVEVETSGSIRKSHYTLDEISKYLTKGIIAVEDKIFYEHKGVDVKRTTMAAAPTP